MILFKHKIIFFKLKNIFILLKEFVAYYIKILLDKKRALLYSVPEKNY